MKFIVEDGQELAIAEDERLIIAYDWNCANLELKKELDHHGMKYNNILNKYFTLKEKDLKLFSLITKGKINKLVFVYEYLI